MDSINAEKTQKILDSISGIYNTMHLINFKENKVHEIYAFKEVHEAFAANKDKLSIQELFNYLITATTDKEYLDSLLEFVNVSTLNERLCGKKILSFDFLGNINGWVRSSFIPVSYNEEGKLEEVIYSTRIIQDDKDREEKLLQKLNIDELTGVYNRRAFDIEYNRIRKEGMSDFFTIVICDVNELKQVNNTMGYEAGDELIKGTVFCLKKVFGEKGKIYRTGGDEFCVFLDVGYKELYDLFGIFDSECSRWKGFHLDNLTVSKGCAAHPEFPELGISELQRRAERRMFQEKEQFYKNKNKNYSYYIKEPGMMEQIAQKTNIGLFSIEIDDNGAGLSIDENVKNFLGLDRDYTPQELYIEWMNGVHKNYKDAITAGIEKIIVGNQSEIEYQWLNKRAGWMYIRSCGFIDPTYTKAIRINGYFQNITTLRHFHHDDLTGLYTADVFFQKVDEYLEKNPKQQFRIFVSDIENFKEINEKYGKETSDELLIYLSKALKKMAPDFIYAGRINADKFVSFQKAGMPQTREEGLRLQQEILQNAPIKNIIWKHGVYYTDYERDISAQQMTDRARSAVESIKGNADVYCALYDGKLARRIKTKHQIVEYMNSALENEEFQVYLQPKYDVKKKRTGGAEALIRWIHPELGFMSPGDFIPVFEQNGFIKKVDQFVFVKICKQIRQWLDEGKPVVPISVNLSRRDFDYADLAEQIINGINKYKVPHELIHFEVTESAYSDNPDHITNTIRKLREAGFAIELDDFGSGYSSLISLTEIEFDVLKLDMSIIRKDNPDSPRNVLDLCSHIMKQMNFKSVAEGVETEAQLHRLESLGCDYIQGYLFSKPLSISDFEAYLAKEAE